jgi:hypothetical protein
MPMARPWDGRSEERDSELRGSEVLARGSRSARFSLAGSAFLPVKNPMIFERRDVSFLTGASVWLLLDVR